MQSNPKTKFNFLSVTYAACSIGTNMEEEDKTWLARHGMRILMYFIST